MTAITNAITRGIATAPQQTEIDRLNTVLAERTAELAAALRRAEYAEDSIQALREEQRQTPHRTIQSPIVCLCGSTRFAAEFASAARALALQGRIVIGPNVFSQSGDPIFDTDVARLTATHWDKIRLADEIHVINPGGYIGDATRAEIRFARKLGKPVTYLNEETK